MLLAGTSLRETAALVLVVGAVAALVLVVGAVAASPAALAGPAQASGPPPFQQVGCGCTASS